MSKLTEFSPTIARHAFQILRRLDREHGRVRDEILETVGLSADELDEALDELRDVFFDELVECGCCCTRHRRGYCGECRNDDERF